MTDFHGIFPYLVSPVEPLTGKIKEDVLRQLVSDLIAKGVHGLSPLGSTGEFAYLTQAQREEIVRIVVDETAGRVPVVPGVSAFSTEEAIEQAQRYEVLGVDGIVLMLQAYFALPPTAIVRYFRMVASAFHRPIVIYTNPGLLGVDITPAMINTLSEVPNIQYVKDASPNTGRLLTTMNLVEGRIKVFSASAHIPLVVLQMGGVGWMSGPACIFPEESVYLYELARSGDWNTAWDVQRRMWRANEVFQKYSLAACIKAGLQLQGYDVGPALLPQEPLPDQAIHEIRHVIDYITGIHKGSRKAWTA
ncbi:MAG: dihydrodipicolinate synthase family protein [Chloroflexota bacterium]|nr:MAG: dihydrodipicolinate synthase family protein [Chloroflexota bacterium]